MCREHGVVDLQCSRPFLCALERGGLTHARRELPSGQCGARKRQAVTYLRIVTVTLCKRRKFLLGLFEAASTERHVRLDDSTLNRLRRNGLPHAREPQSWHAVFAI